MVEEIKYQVLSTASADSTTYVKPIAALTSLDASIAAFKAKFHDMNLALIANLCGVKDSF